MYNVFRRSFVESYLQVFVGYLLDLVDFQVSQGIDHIQVPTASQNLPDFLHVIMKPADFGVDVANILHNVLHLGVNWC